MLKGPWGVLEDALPTPSARLGVADLIHLFTVYQSILNLCDFVVVKLMFKLCLPVHSPTACVLAIFCRSGKLETRYVLWFLRTVRDHHLEKIHLGRYSARGFEDFQLY